MRSQLLFPLKGYEKLCSFLNTAWIEGWLDEYSDNHFLIKAIENRLEAFVGKEQLIENDLNMQGIIDFHGNANMVDFNRNFCINFSNRMQFLVQKFGKNQIKHFMTDQMSAGKKHYKEDTFFQALSEVSVLSFYASTLHWFQMTYEPAMKEGGSLKNPEASLNGMLCCRADIGNEAKLEKEVTINIEVKSPEFPHDRHENERIVIPTVLLTDPGREKVKKFCKDKGIKYLDPRVKKLKDFINSAADKFRIPGECEFNLLYINWSYRDFPSNSFLEAWSLMTNEINGILIHPELAIEIGISPEAFKKITAIIVYTESLEGLMFGDLRYFWQRCGAGPRFRMWVLDEKLRKAEREDRSNILFYSTGMNPSDGLTQMAMADFKSANNEERAEAERLGKELVTIIGENMKLK